MRPRRFEVLGCLHFVDVTRISHTMPGVASFSSLSEFGPRDESARRVDGVRAPPRRRRRGTHASTRRYSLQWFQSLFVAAISKAEKAETLELRLDVLNTFFTYYVYVNVCRC